MGYVTDPCLSKNIKHLAKRVQKGFFNIVIVWGPTRTGKSTNVFQCAKDLADELGISFTAKDNVWFSSKEILDAGKQGIRKAIYVLDEASFDGKGIDWQNKDQQNLIKLFNTAAKFNQTYFLLLPNLEELKSTFIRDAHSMGMQIGYNSQTLERGFFRMYSKKQFLHKYWMLVNKQYQQAEEADYAWQGTFTDNLSFFDVEAYNEKKDQAIRELGEDKEQARIEGKGVAKLWKERFRRLTIKNLRAKVITPQEINRTDEIPMEELRKWVREDAPELYTQYFPGKGRKSSSLGSA